VESPPPYRRRDLAGIKAIEDEQAISRHRLAELLNEDLAREYQAIIAYVVYSQVPARSAISVRCPTVTLKQVKTSEDAK
jgi:hypothetical protein